MERATDEFVAVIKEQRRSLFKHAAEQVLGLEDDPRRRYVGCEGHFAEHVNVASLGVNDNERWRGAAEHCRQVGEVVARDG